MAPAYNNHTKTRPMETRSKYKEAPDRYVNITYDRRIVRGNTYGQHLVSMKCSFFSAFFLIDFFSFGPLYFKDVFLS